MSVEELIGKTFPWKWQTQPGLMDDVQCTIKDAFVTPLGRLVIKVHIVGRGVDHYESGGELYFKEAFWSTATDGSHFP